MLAVCVFSPSLGATQPTGEDSLRREVQVWAERGIGAQALEAVWLTSQEVKIGDDTESGSVVTRETTVFCLDGRWRIQTRLESLDEGVAQVPGETPAGVTAEQLAWASWARRLESDMVRGSDLVVVTKHARQNRFSRAPAPDASIWDSAPGMLRRIPELSPEYLAFLFQSDQGIGSVSALDDGTLRVDGLPDGLSLELERIPDGFRVDALETKLGRSGDRALRWEFEQPESPASGELGAALTRRVFKEDGDAPRELLSEDRRVAIRAVPPPSPDQFVLDLAGTLAHNPSTGELIGPDGEVKGRIPGHGAMAWARGPVGLLLSGGTGLAILALGWYMIRRWGTR